MPALGVVALLIMAIAALPGVTPSASSDPSATPPVVTVAIHDTAPFVMTQGSVKSGFTIDILDRVSKRTGWTIDYLEFGTVADQLESVTNGRADAAAGGLSITSERSPDFDFSQPTLNAGLQIMVPAGLEKPSQPGLAEFLTLLFSKATLVWLTIAAVGVILPVALIRQIQRRRADPMPAQSPPVPSPPAHSWPVHSWPVRVLAVVWASVGIVFVAYFTATLAANLTVAKFGAKISSPADLFGKRVCTVAGTTSAIYLAELGVDFEAMPRIDDCYAGLQNDSVDAVVYDSPVLRYYLSQDGAGSVAIAGPIFEREDYGIAFRNGSGLRKQFDEALLRMQEDGDYDLIIRKWFGEPADTGH